MPKKKGKNVSFRYKIIVSNFKKSFKKCEEANKKLSFCGQFMKNQFHPIVKNWACMAKFSRILLVVSRNVTLKNRRFVTGISTKQQSSNDESPVAFLIQKQASLTTTFPMENFH